MELRNLLRLLIRNIWIILLVLIVAVVATYVYTNQQPVVYTARATFVARLNESLMDERSAASALDLLSRSTEISTTYSEVAKSRRIKFFAGERIGLDPAVRSVMIVNSRVLPGTNIIEVSAEGTDPELARDYANAVGQETIEYVRGLYGAYELVQLDEAIAPFNPSRPNKTFNLILGGVAGLFLGIGMAFLSASLSSPEKTEESREPGGELAAPQINQDIQQLRHELSMFQVQFDLTQKQMEQTRAALSSTQQDAEKVRNSMHTFVNMMNNHRSDEADEGEG